MKTLSEKLEEIILNERGFSKIVSPIENYSKFCAEMKNVGVIKKPTYNIPLVDTIGKAHFSSINKKMK